MMRVYDARNRKSVSRKPIPRSPDKRAEKTYRREMQNEPKSTFAKKKSMVQTAMPAGLGGWLF